MGKEKERGKEEKEKGEHEKEEGREEKTKKKGEKKARKRRRKEKKHVNERRNNPKEHLDYDFYLKLKIINRLYLFFGIPYKIAIILSLCLCSICQKCMYILMSQAQA
uniref:Uncharacterized protein n=1 Tax=Strongyloides stercoralis TaxID=6248 RepID=A0AAF5DJD0_STRER